MTTTHKLLDVCDVIEAYRDLLVQNSHMGVDIKFQVIQSTWRRLGTFLLTFLPHHNLTQTWTESLMPRYLLLSNGPQVGRLFRDLLKFVKTLHNHLQTPR